MQEDFRRRHVGGGAATKTAEGYGAAGRGRGRGGWRGRGRGRSFGTGRGRGDYNEGHGSSSGRGSTRMEGTCWYCKKVGHPWFKCFSRPEGWSPPGMKPPSGERAQGGAVQGSGAQVEGAQGNAYPGMYLMVEDVHGHEGDVGSVGKVVMHPLTHWVIDSGCTSHMTPRADLLDEVKPPGKIKYVAAASGALLPVIGVGNAKVKGANGELVGLGNVLLVKGLSANLLSVRRLQKSKAEVTFGPTSCRAKLGKKVLWSLEEETSCIKDLWQLPIIPWNGKTPTAATAAAAKATAGGDATAPTDGVLEAVKKVQQQQTHGEVLAGVDASAAWAKASSRSGEADWETWHERLCHVNFPMLQKLVKDGSLKGLEVKGGLKEIGSCPTCLETKFSKFPFNSTTGPAKTPLALVHMDVVGPTRAPSLSGSRYFLTIVDDHTRAVWVYPLKSKGEVAAAVLKEWMPRAQRECGHKVKVIRSDNGGEFIGADFEGELKRKGIQHQLTVPYNPQQNGVAERFNRTLQEGARTLLGRAGLPDPFWVSALRQVALVKNRVLATVGDKEWIPYVKWYGSAPAVNMLRAFGCMVVFHVPKEKRGKLEASGRWGVHLGIAKDHKAWLLWDLTTQKLTKVQQQQTHGEVLAGVDASAAWAKASSRSGEADWETWHERLCHVNFPMLQKLVKDGSLKGLEVKGGLKEIGSCPTCLETKFSKFPFNSTTGPAKTPLALVHMDVVGPTRAPSLSGSRYFLTIVDDHTRAVWVYPLKSKGEVAAAVLKEWMPRAQRECGHKVKVIRSDNGGEFIGADFEGELKRKGIQHQLTVPYNPQQNGVAERFNRTLQEGARTLLGRAGLPDPFWVSALRQVALVKNRVLATVGDKEWIPYVKWYGSAPAVNMLRAFGCMVVFHVPKEKRGKLEASGRWGVHLGIAKDHKAWLLWDLTTQNLTVSRDVKFLESLYYKEWKQQQQKLPSTPLVEVDEVQRPSRQVEVAVSEEEMSGVTEEGGAAEVEQQQQQHESPPRVPHPPERPRRDVRPPVRLTYGGRGKPNVVQAGSVVEQIEEDEIAHCYWAPIPEYMALHHGAKEVVWLRRLLEELGVGQEEPTVVFCDNESAVKLAKNACLHGLTKHIRPKWHWVRRLLDKEVRLEIVKTHQQAADIFTKRLAEADHWKGMKLAGMSVH
ncbi:hypothetical protein CLOM_g14148 [Closterium sp. NIES-68]|nr:hypothetical protein CLOM_g14148 [Closterium sp. NIES-68]